MLGGYDMICQISSMTGTAPIVSSQGCATYIPLVCQLCGDEHDTCQDAQTLVNDQCQSAEEPLRKELHQASMLEQFMPGSRAGFIENFCSKD